MLDINDFIVARGGNPDKIKESQRRRGKPEEIVDQVIELFEEQRKARYAVTQHGSTINANQKAIGEIKKAKGDATELLQKKADLEKEKADLEKAAVEKEAALWTLAKTVGNYVDDTVPVSNNEDDNKTERTWGDEKTKTEVKLSHHEVMLRLQAYDPVRGVKLIGHRGYCLTGYGVFLNQALINYGLEFLFNKGYTPNQPPFFLNRDQMAKTAQLSQFDEELYKVSEGDGNPATDKYLIATSEQPLSCAHSSEWLNKDQVPIKYAGYSTCFRKEAGGHGRDAWGTFRVHQFEKVEQFIYCKPEDSVQHLEDMIATSEEFYKSLGLPYRVVSIVSGALNDAAAKKYDLEAWFPFQKEYKELVSCSNCTDYQTRELEVRYGQKITVDKKKGAKADPADERKTYVHALNATLCATERTLCGIMENYQTEDGLGFTVPEVLRKYIPGSPAYLPFTAELPEVVDKTKTDAKSKAKVNLPTR
ncbi:26S proteasome regulatory subunit [Venturia nashicola]|uniref:serine--tRNA ligase n=1 Tax=Venturia nashicola TaxID=86259 RepID=A0A4Z1P392_9PEZI|nr:26S proteasome regulatory subunit [Venturia nashicola]TLD35930.1 26S proteasome regulatory subunit [Venturia nashicola]